MLISKYRVISPLMKFLHLAQLRCNMDGDMRNWANPQIGHFEIWTKKGKFIIIKSEMPK